MRYIWLLSVCGLAVLILSAAARAQTPAPGTADQVVISEVQTGVATGLSKEFVELYNPTNEAISLRGWELEQRAAGSGGGCQDGWFTRATVGDNEDTVNTVIQPRGFFLFVTQEYIDAHSQGETAFAYDAVFSQALADSGHVRISQPAPEDSVSNVTPVDLVGWGEAECGEGAPDFPAPGAPGTKKSLKRIFNSDGLPQDSDVNFDDFVISADPYPQSTPPPEPPSGSDPPGDNPDDTGSNPDDEGADNEDTDAGDNEEENNDEQDAPDPDPDEPAAYPTLRLSELLPDPAQPQSDTEDESVELYNPHSRPVDLEGYILKTGSNLQTSHTFGATTMRARSYRTFVRSDISVSLPNAGGRVQLLDPAGTVVSTLVSYQEAPTGEAWAQLDGQWQWTDIITPDAANQPRRRPEPSTSNSSERSGAAAARSYMPVAVTELLPDPAQPQTDADDEFVELFNPHQTPVHVEGYRLRSGSDLTTTYTLPDLTIAPGNYVAIFASEANLSLVNSGGSVRLEDPAGQAVAEVEPYPEAVTGSAWALHNGQWQWTETPTPAAKNTVTAVETAGAEPAGHTAADAAVDTATSNNSLAQPATVTPSRTSQILVAGAAAVALLYGLYEWRHDIRNRIYLTRRHFARWRSYRV